MVLNACADSPLSLRERAGVRAPFTVKPPVEKAAPFSTLLRCRASTMEPSQPNLRVESPLSLRERAGVRAPFTVKPPVEKAAPFSTLRPRWASTMELSQPNLRVESPLSLRERAGMRARFAVKPQWKRLRRFPRYGTVGLRQCSCLNPTYALHG